VRCRRCKDDYEKHEYYTWLDRKTDPPVERRRKVCKPCYISAAKKWNNENPEKHKVNPADQAADPTYSQ